MKPFCPRCEQDDSVFQTADSLLGRWYCDRCDELFIESGHILDIIQKIWRRIAFWR